MKIRALCSKWKKRIKKSRKYFGFSKKDKKNVQFRKAKILLGFFVEILPSLKSFIVLYLGISYVIPFYICMHFKALSSNTFF